MAVVATITDQINLGPRLMVEGTLAFSGNYATGGEIPTYAGLKTSKSTPIRMYVNAIAGLYQFSYDPLTGKLVVGQGDNDNAADAPGAQLTNAAAYPAGLTGSVTYFTAFFKKP